MKRRTITVVEHFDGNGKLLDKTITTVDDYENEEKAVVDLPESTKKEIKEVCDMWKKEFEKYLKKPYYNNTVDMIDELSGVTDITHGVEPKKEATAEQVHQLALFNEEVFKIVKGQDGIDAE